MAKDYTQEIIEETRQSIISLRKKKELNKNLISSGKYKCSRCFIIKSLDMFYKDSSKNCGFSRCCKECAPVTRSKATKKYQKRIRENLEDIYVKRLLCAKGINLEDLTDKMIIKKREAIQENRDKAIFKDMLLKEDKRICRICNKAKKNNTFIKKSHLTNVCLDCYKPMVKASKENKKTWEREYRLKNADRLRERRRLYVLNNPEIIKKGRQREKIKIRESFLNSINTCNDCNIKLGLKKDTKGMRVCNNCKIIRIEMSNKRAKERLNNLSEEERTELKNKQNKKKKKERDNLDDTYIKSQLCSGGILKVKDIPLELIKAKREQLRLKRFLEK